MNKVPMTVRGAELLRNELKSLKSIDRPNVITAISEARAHGDLKENAEYHAAKEQQGFIEGRIKEIESKLSNIQEIDVTAIDANGKIVFGATVRLIDLQTDEEITYKIVGEDEADIKIKLISYSSPIARALIGKTEGD
ncbi:MAG: transcription elongation factor GreA, partial [Pseudomonadota bacterium]|nr:transcription elongation factor GreA [Pseudomonadota bacterium]